MSIEPGRLYVVATPIGNLEDWSPRAVDVLKQVDLIAAEDTRHSGRLMAHFGIKTHMQAMHEHNERQRAESMVELLQRGQSIALISDAGTPLLSDPGFPLVRAVREAGLRVVPVPGVSALVTALSVAGLPTDRFRYEGFPPRQTGPRKALFESLQYAEQTLVFYEAKHRIQACLEDMVEVFGAERPAVLCRELTKQYETILDGSLAELNQRLQEDEEQRLGEFVVLLHGYEGEPRSEASVTAEKLLQALIKELPVKKAAAVAAEVLGERKNRMYELALCLKE